MDDREKQELRDSIEEKLATRLPQFTNKGEVMQHVNGLISAKRNTGVTDGSERTAGSSGLIRGTVHGYQGNGGGSPTIGQPVISEGAGEARLIHARDGRYAGGERSIDGLDNELTGNNREPTNIGIGSNQYNGPANGIGEAEVYAPKRAGLGQGIKSKFKPFKDAFTKPIEKKPRVTSTPRSTSKKTAYNTLSNAEALALRPKLVEYITWQSEHMDQIIIATTKGHDPTIMIWADLEESEIEIIADFLIERGRSNAPVAQGIRFAATIVDRIKVAVILAPRVYKTVNIYLARGLDIPIFVRPAYGQYS